MVFCFASSTFNCGSGFAGTIPSKPYQRFKSAKGEEEWCSASPVAHLTAGLASQELFLRSPTSGSSQQRAKKNGVLLR
ncbi:MAG: hypothetical protein M0R48_09100, partial [Candidatus Omnitrophica bacterium]|nr:hypothetical protein [Candidatus Omnitrophota bacterium]